MATSKRPAATAALMVAALESGKVRAYATDVWQSDPPPADDPLLKAPNVIKVPHIGASSVENLARIGDECVERIEDFLVSEHNAALLGAGRAHGSRHFPVLVLSTGRLQDIDITWPVFLSVYTHIMVMFFKGTLVQLKQNYFY